MGRNNYSQLPTREKVLFVGVDVHKNTHTAVGLSLYGEKIFEMVIFNYSKDFVSLIERVKKEADIRGLEPVFGLEDVQSYGKRLSSFLVEKELPVVVVAPVLVDHRRSKTTHPEKSDSLDAEGVAEVMIRRIDSLPIYTLTEKMKFSKQIREISREREIMVKEKTRLKNQLHTLLYDVYNSGYQKRFKDPFSKKAMRCFMRSAPKNADVVLVRRMKRFLRRLRSLQEESQEIEKELSLLMQKGKYTLATASGCGTVIAATIIGEVGDINRFHSPGALAKYAGCAPREHSSGKSIRHRKTRAGNRTLNCAFHRMALSQISRSGNSAARAYYQKKISEGKTKMQALVCLRRQLVNIVWMMMRYNAPYIYPRNTVDDIMQSSAYEMNSEANPSKKRKNKVVESILSNEIRTG